MTRRTPFLAALLAVVIAFSGCVAGDRLETMSPEEAFVQGKELYDAGRYMRATEYFQRVFDFGRAHEWAADAQYYLGHSYFQTRQYLLAANAFSRFIGFYRNDPRVEEGTYMRALSYVRLSPQYQLDQTDTQNALEFLHLYVTEFPDGEYVDEALAYVHEMRDKLARKQFEIAERYEQRSQYQAAAIEYLRVLDRHPESAYADASLVGALRSYKLFAERSIPARRAERYQLAAEQYERFVQLFPQSPLISEAEALHAEVQAALAQTGATAAG